jgi:hypothetical protein
MVMKITIHNRLTAKKVKKMISLMKWIDQAQKRLRVSNIFLNNTIYLIGSWEKVNNFILRRLHLTLLNYSMG